MTPTAPNLNAGQLQLGEFLAATKTPPSSQTVPVTEPARPSKQQDAPPGPTKPSITTLPREELLDQIFRSVCNPTWRRWEKELYFGATDEELSRVMGNLQSFGDEVNTAFQTAAEPALTVTYRVFDIPVVTATFAEVAQYIRRIVQIPEKKSPEECAKLLEEKLEEIRSERRAEITSYVRSLTGEKYRATTRRKKKKSEPEPEDYPPTLTEQIVNLLYAPDCMTEASDQRLLIRITQLLHRKANLEILKAAESALSIIKRAKSDWRCYTPYWTDDFAKHVESAYQEGKEIKEGSEPAPP